MSGSGAGPVSVQPSHLIRLADTELDPAGRAAGVAPAAVTDVDAVLLDREDEALAALDVVTLTVDL
jgi:hypothetical protein